jgi:membrane-bound serine protease (ClpP class)
MPLSDGFRFARLVTVLFVGLFPCSAAVAQAQGNAEPRRFSRPVLIQFEGEIGPLKQQFLFRKLEVARKEQADLVIVEIDSPGGTVDASFAIAERLRDVDWAHTVAFIPHEAISGGAFVALGCTDIVMDGEAVMGDAGPIFREGGAIFFQHVPEKIRSYIERRVRDLAEAKGRPPALAEAMVDNKLKVFEVRNEEGEINFMSEAEIDDAKKGEPPVNWVVVKPVIETTDDDFLTVNGVRAVDLKLAQGIVADRDELKQHYNVSGDFKVLRWTAVDTTVMILNNPWITGLLFVIGLIALYVEFSAPGISIGGLIAALCFALFFWSRFLGGTAGWLEVILFLMGLIFLGVEIFVLPGFGISGLTGILLIIASLVMASQAFALPDTNLKLNVLLMNLFIVCGAMVAVIVLTIFLSSYFGTIPLVNRMALKPPAIDETTAAEVAGKGAVPTALGGTSAAVPMLPLQVGDIGVADSLLRPAGKAIFAEEPYDVVTEGTFIEKGSQVKIIKIRSNQVVVRAVEDA